MFAPGAMLSPRNGVSMSDAFNHLTWSPAAVSMQLVSAPPHAKPLNHDRQEVAMSESKSFLIDPE